MEDTVGDGMCCARGDGFFAVYLNGDYVGGDPNGDWSEHEVYINCN